MRGKLVGVPSQVILSEKPDNFVYCFALRACQEPRLTDLPKDYDYHPLRQIATKMIIQKVKNDKTKPFCCNYMRVFRLHGIIEI